MLSTDTRTRNLWQSNEKAFYNIFRTQHSLKLKVHSFDDYYEYSITNIPGCRKEEMIMHDFLLEKQRYMSYMISVKISNDKCVKEFDRFLSDCDQDRLQIETVQI